MHIVYHRLPCVLLIMLVAFILPVGHATGRMISPATFGVQIAPTRSSTTARAFAEFEWPSDERVRSAGRIRDAGLQAAGGVDPGVERARLQAHFAFVVSWIEAHNSESLDLAVARLIAASAEPVLHAERVAIRASLRNARARQLRALKGYAKRGLFPLNPEGGGLTRPLFVDASDTACAVGHLMLMDGYTEAVQAIHRNDNGIFISDVVAGPVIDWVANSGLTLEEAAVIQPGYAPPSSAGHDLDALSGGGSSSASGLVIENFSARHVTLPPFVTVQFLEALFPGVDPVEAAILFGVTPIVNHFGPGDWSDITLHSGFDYVSPQGGQLISFYDTLPVKSPWLFWNALPAGGFFSDPGGSNRESWFEISYDVSVATPGYGIDASHFSIPGGHWGSPANFGADLHSDVVVAEMGGLELLRFSETGGLSTDPFGNVYQSANGAFAAQSKIRVTVRGGQQAASQATQWSNLEQNFNVVPVPESSFALLIGAGSIFITVRRRA